MKLGIYFSARPTKKDPTIASVEVQVCLAGVKSARRAIGRFVPVKSLKIKNLLVVGEPDTTRILRNLKEKIRQIHDQHLLAGKALEANDLLHLGLDIKNKKEMLPMLVECYEKYITTQKQPLVATGALESATVKRYYHYKESLAGFVLSFFGQNDVKFDSIKPSLAEEYYIYLTTTLKHKTNFAIKQISQLKSVIEYALANGFADRNPIKTWSKKREHHDPEFLTDDEIQTLENLQLTDETLRLVLDGFLAQIYTGLAYIDLKNLTKKDFKNDIEGGSYIELKRQKSGVVSIIPIWAKAKKIIEKYSEDSRKSEHEIMPLLSNQKMNSHLKSIAQIAKIRKNVCTHLGRKTCANYLLNRGLSYEVVQNVLGHKSSSMTEAHYARVRKDMVLREAKKIII
jgi:site-specific recombinase XerD